MYQMLQNNYDSNFVEPCNEQCSFCFLDYTDVLSANSLFRGLGKNEIGNIIRGVHHSVKEYKRGELIAFEGDTCDRLIMIVKGSVVGEMMDFEGRVLRVEQRIAPETVATVFLFGENNRLPVTITALEETRLLFIPRDDLLQLFARNRTVLKNFMDIMADRAQFLSMHLKLLGLNSIKGKIAHYLLGQVKEQGKNEIRIPHTQTELSEMFGVTRPSVARAIRKLNDEGIISSMGKNIRIIDKTSLSAFLK
ncbi:MAG TPA: Crp/Fnr family transcriptional regulator [Bacteroidetes bacterium]|nr:Crp/Fnr family transcriptional regulator [Bacteroidota bacterium]